MIHRLAVLFASALLLAACTSPSVEDDPPVVYSVSGGVSDVLVIEDAPGMLADLVGGDTVVHFAFDSAAITPEARTVISHWAEGLIAHPDLVVIVEGHCDERGSREYNLALGDRRANAVRELLIAMGVGPSRIGTISFGKERPAVAGHTPEAWAANRRGVLVLE